MYITVTRHSKSTCVLSQMKMRCKTLDRYKSSDLSLILRIHFGKMNQSKKMNEFFFSFKYSYVCYIICIHAQSSRLFLAQRKISGD